MKHIYLFGEVSTEMSLDIIKHITNANGSLTLHINSEGGLVYDALAIVDAIRASDEHITTRGYGLIASASVPILAAGHNREMSPNAWVFLHEGSVKLARQTVAQLQKSMHHEARLEKQYCDVLEQLSNTNWATWQGFCKGESYLSAKDCLRFGLIDKILEGLV